MHKKKLIIAAAMVGVLLIIYQVNTRWIIPRSAVSDAVKRYDRVLQQAMANVEAEKMLKVATLEEAQRVELDMMRLGQKNRYLDAKLLNIDILEISLDGSRAVARTREKWQQEERDYNTREVKVTDTVNYLNTYSLEKKKGKWLVSKLAKYKQ